MESKKHFPRVLIVSSAGVNDKSATGLTLMSLFNGWPIDRIAQIQSDLEGPDIEICSEYRRVTNHDIPGYDIARSSLAKIRRRRPSDLSNSNKTITHFKATATSAWLDMVPIRLSGSLLRWLDDFQPAVIHSVLGNIRMMNISLRISKRYNIPVVPHFMDDWPTTRYSLGHSNLLPRKFLLTQLGKVFTRSPLGMTISDVMAQEYQQRYKRPFESFMKCVEVNRNTQKPKALNNNIIRFGYIGGLHLNRWQALEEIGESLMKIQDDVHSVELAVFAPAADIERYRSILRHNPAVSTYGTLPADKVRDALKAFDVLVHIESFDEYNSLYTRYSISTKIPQYMAAGRPILAYGPLELASCKHIKDFDCGLVVGKQDVSLLDETVKRLAIDADLRALFGKNARAAALKKHNAAIVRRRFREVLQKVASIDI